MSKTVIFTDGPDILLTTDGVGIERKRRVLSAMQKELEEAKAESREALIALGVALSPLDGLRENAYESAMAVCATITAQAERIKELESTIAEIKSVVRWYLAPNGFDSPTNIKAMRMKARILLKNRPTRE